MTADDFHYCFVYCGKCPPGVCDSRYARGELVMQEAADVGRHVTTPKEGDLPFRDPATDPPTEDEAKATLDPIPTDENELLLTIRDAVAKGLQWYADEGVDNPEYGGSIIDAISDTVERKLREEGYSK